MSVAKTRVEIARSERDSEHLDAAADALDRMEALIDDVLTLAREGQDIGETEPVDIASVATRAWGSVDAPDAEFVVDDAPTVEADADRLRQLLENLFRNAVDHGGPTVTVRVGPLTDGGGFYVADDGPGIPESEREDVFEAGHTTADDGTGFGLAIVTEIVDAHDWRIDVTESDEGGARFEIRTE